MTNKEALSLINDCLENHFLNLHDGHWPEDAKEFETALEMTEVIIRDKSNG
tara:strand:- start:1 stop:153 length:153 start_codon:yes stop_codon:yes gene_type:complete